MKTVMVVVALALAAAPPARQQDPPANPATAAARAEDIAAFRTGFLAKDRSYTTSARAEAERRLMRLEAMRDRVSQAYFELELARIVALADNGHTLLPMGAIAGHFNRIDLRLAPMNGAFYVLRARDTLKDLLGAKLIGIDAHGVARIRDAARQLAGGTAARRDLSATPFIESPEQLHAFGLAADPHTALYRFELPDGRRIARKLTGTQPGPERRHMAVSRLFLPERDPQEPDGWVALTPATIPFAFADASRRFRWLPLPQIDALLIDLRANTNIGDTKIADFLSEAVTAIGTHTPRNLVLDMRLNGGGDLNTTRDFMQGLPGRVPGRIFVLTSPWTFSAAISSIGYLKQAAPERVTIVGEPVGDRLMFFAEGLRIALPNAKLAIGYATERHDYRGGCREYDDCHGPVVRHPIAVKSLAPDIAAPWTIAAYRAGRDPALEAVARALRR